MTAGRSVKMECPRCRAPHNEYRLTCRRCGHYLQTSDSSAQALSIPPGVLGVILVALIAAVACVIMFWPKQQTTPAVAPKVQTDKTGTEAADQKSSSKPTKKRRGKRRQK